MRLQNRQVQVTLDGTTLLSQPQENRSGEEMVEGEKYSSRWSRLMKKCYSYIKFHTERGHKTRLDEIRNYMLREYGLRYETTSSILWDLDRIGVIKSMGNRILSTENQQHLVQVENKVRY